jgi:hypothetical protein
VPQDLTLATFEGQPGGNADTPDVDVEDDSSWAWIVFRQDIGGRSRTFARRLVGSLYDPPFSLDGGQTSFEPRVSITGRGLGEAVASTSDNTVLGSYLDSHDAFERPGRLGAGGAAPGDPVAAASEHGDMAVAWIQDGVAHARLKSDRSFGGTFTASRSGAGAVVPASLSISNDRHGNTAVAMLQGAAGARTVTAAVFDRPPGRASARSSSARQSPGRPTLKWAPAVDLWGSLRYRVVIDGHAVGKTSRTSLTPHRRYTGGTHKWYVVTIDRRGQKSKGRTRFFRVSR